VTAARAGDGDHVDPPLGGGTQDPADERGGDLRARLGGAAPAAVRPEREFDDVGPERIEEPLESRLEPGGPALPRLAVADGEAAVVRRDASPRQRARDSGAHGLGPDVPPEDVEEVADADGAGLAPEPLPGEIGIDLLAELGMRREGLPGAGEVPEAGGARADDRGRTPREGAAAEPGGEGEDPRDPRVGRQAVQGEGSRRAAGPLVHDLELEPEGTDGVEEPRVPLPPRRRAETARLVPVPCARLLHALDDWAAEALRTMIRAHQFGARGRAIAADILPSLRQDGPKPRGRGARIARAGRCW